MDILDKLKQFGPKFPYKDAADEIESLRRQLAAALVACEAKDTILRGITLYRAFNGDDWPAREATQALAIKPDASALKQHDEALIERCAAMCDRRTKTVSNGNGICYRSHDPASVAAEYCATAIREMKGTL